MRLPLLDVRPIWEARSLALQWRSRCRHRPRRRPVGRGAEFVADRRSLPQPSTRPRASSSGSRLPSGIGTKIEAGHADQAADQSDDRQRGAERVEARSGVSSSVISLSKGYESAATCARKCGEISRSASIARRSAADPRRVQQGAEARRRCAGPRRRRAAGSARRRGRAR